MLYKSIRFKIAALYMAILAITLVSFSTILYHNVKNGLYGNTDTLLTSRAEGISQAINTYWEASNLESGYDTAKIESLQKRRNTNFALVAERWVRQRSDDPKLLDIIVHIFDTDGHAIASSKKTGELPAVPQKNFISVLQGKKRFDTLVFENTGNKMSLRIFTTPVFENDKVAYIVQVAIPLSSIEDALKNLKVALFILLPITVIFTGMMGAFLAKVTLNPVNSMISTINKITARNMHLKLSIPDTRDEIQKLAETFNAMLGSLEHSFTSQKQLFEDLSHELKTPLTVLKGELEVILKKMRSPQEYQHVLTSSLEEVNKIIKLAENLLLLARLDSKEVVPEKETLDLNALIEKVVNNMKSLAGLKNISISFVPRGGLILYGDMNQLRTLFLNIIDNAVKYTGHGGAVRIASEKNSYSAKVTIEDNGAGIPEEEAVHIFDRFYRIDKSRSTNKGFGLGLSIARSIVDSHNGTIEVKSCLGQGTIFTITLPLS